MRHVEGDRDAGGTCDQGPGIPGLAPALAAQVPPQDDQGGGGGEAVDQQRRRPGEGGGEGGGLDREGADGLEGHDIGQGGDGQDQGGEGGDQGDADRGQQPLGAGGLVAGVRWGAKHRWVPGGGWRRPGAGAAGPPQGQVSAAVLVADRAQPAGGAAFAAGLAADAGELPAAGGTGRDPDAAQQMQGRLRRRPARVG